MEGGNAPVAENTDILTAVQQLGQTWHELGTTPDAVLTEIFRIGQTADLQHTMETGSGRTTLLLSNLSKNHRVFTLAPPESDRNNPDYPYTRVQGSPLLQTSVTEFILGPTQRTLPSYKFEQAFDFVLLDGPHSYPFPELEYFFVYPHIKPGGYLVIDDIWIPTIYNMFAFLKEDAMFHLETVVANTAFFTRTNAPLFDPYGDNWPGQAYNKARFPIVHTPPPAIEVLKDRVRGAIPQPVKNAIKKGLGRE